MNERERQKDTSLDGEEPGPACREKLPYASEAEARAAAMLAAWRYGTKLKVYRCRDCASWHLSSS